MVKPILWGVLALVVGGWIGFFISGLIGLQGGIIYVVGGGIA